MLTKMKAFISNPRKALNSDSIKKYKGHTNVTELYTITPLDLLFKTVIERKLDVVMEELNMLLNLMGF